MRCICGICILAPGWKYSAIDIILGLHVGHVGGEVQKNILSILLWAPAVVGEQHCLVVPERLVANQEFGRLMQHFREGGKPGTPATS